jgi:hypothetical protein
MSYITLNTVAGRGYFRLLEVQSVNDERRQDPDLEAHVPRRARVPEAGTFFKFHRTLDVRESKLQPVLGEAVQFTPEVPSPR